MLDLEAESRPFNLAETKQMQMMKTGALISCAVLSGGIVAGADHALLTAQATYARHLGLAFQIADDLLDYDGDSARLANQRQDAYVASWFYFFYGTPGSSDRGWHLIDDANKALAPWKEAADYMQNLAEFAITQNVISIGSQRKTADAVVE